MAEDYEHGGCKSVGGEKEALFTDIETFFKIKLLQLMQRMKLSKFFQCKVFLAEGITDPRSRAAESTFLGWNIKLE